MLLVFQNLLAGKFEFIGQQFHLNGESFQMRSGEIHLPRIPFQFWDHRIRMAKSMGMNTIAIYVFWNQHEQVQGKFDFTSPQLNLQDFFDLCKQNDMWVFLRPGPYVCAEFEFGGMPSWLLKPERLQIRTQNDQAHFAAVTSYIRALAPLVNKNMIYNNGQILMVQLENEYTGSIRRVAGYIELLHQLWLDGGVTGPFCSADNYDVLHKDARISGAAIGLNNHHPNVTDFDAAHSFDPNVPAFVSELWSGWFISWGEKGFFETVESNVTQDVRYYMDNDLSFNFYVIHGGTNFAGTSGGGGWDTHSPCLTSYDYGAPIDERGAPTALYYEYRDIIQSYLDEPLPEVPPEHPTIAINEIAMKRISSLWDEMSHFVNSKTEAKWFEFLDQDQGYAIYSTTVPKSQAGGKLKLDRIKDWAAVYWNEEMIAQFDDTKEKQKPVYTIPASKSESNKLEIFVEGFNHKNNNDVENDRKGVWGDMTFNNQKLESWNIRRFPLYNISPAEFYDRPTTSGRIGGIFQGFFELPTTGNTFFEFKNYEKGTVWINGHNIGRYWNIGPQYRLFCPGVWLAKGKNEIVIIDNVVRDASPVSSFERQFYPKV